MTRRNFNVKTQSFVLLFVLAISMYGTINASAGYWISVQDDDFIGYTGSTLQGASGSGGGSGTYSCEETSNLAYLEAESGQGSGNAYCKYDTDYGAGHDGYAGKSGIRYFASATIHIKGSTADEEAGSNAYLRITVELYYSNGPIDQPLRTKVVTFYSTSTSNDFDQDVTLSTSYVRLSVDTRLYIRVTVNAYATTGSEYGGESSVDFSTQGRVITLKHWYLYKYYESNIF